MTFRGVTGRWIRQDMAAVWWPLRGRLWEKWLEARSRAGWVDATRVRDNICTWHYLIPFAVPVLNIVTQIAARHRQKSSISSSREKRFCVVYGQKYTSGRIYR